MVRSEQPPEGVVECERDSTFYGGFVSEGADADLDVWFGLMHRGAYLFRREGALADTSAEED